MNEAELEARLLPVAEDGAIHVPAFTLPMSPALSPESRARLTMALTSPMRKAGAFPNPHDFAGEAEFKRAVDKFRQDMDEGIGRRMVEGLLAQMPVDIAPSTVGGVPVEQISPQTGPDAERVLINLHGGAFFSGAMQIARVESIPMAYRGKFRVVAVDYRQGYEHKFPTASEDVAAVYGALLEDYAPSQIGIYGGSAGGTLTAQATAWILEHGLPAPGAIGIFGAGAGGVGDSAYFSALGTGERPPKPMDVTRRAPVGYFSTVRENDPMVNPNIAPQALRAKFPPSLLITGTRAFDLSPAIATHRALVQAGAESSLHVFDGLGHCFYYDAITPESVDAYETIIRFFRKHLSRRGADGAHG